MKHIIIAAMIGYDSLMATALVLALFKGGIFWSVFGAMMGVCIIISALGILTGFFERQGIMPRWNR